MNRYTLDTSVEVVPGVGATRKKQLSKLGIETLRDLIYTFPRAYEKRGDVILLSEATTLKKEAFLLTVASSVKTATIRRGLTISKFFAFDDSGKCEILFFNSPYVKDIFHIGTTFRFFAKATKNRYTIQFTNPKFEPYIPETPLPEFVPLYQLTEGISSKFIDKATEWALNEVVYEIKDPLPDRIRISNSLPVLSYALKNIHLPETQEALFNSMRRLAFDEMFLFALGISMTARRNRDADGVSFSPCDLTKLLQKLPFELTKSQKNAVNDIYSDIVKRKGESKKTPMSRIIVGDVGSGKTICAIIAMFIAAKSNFQSALMVPTEILAKQHYADITSLLSSFDIKCELLIGSTTPKEKRRICEELENGNIDILVGTHSLISDGVNFNNLGLIITDEQHRFGIGQRAVLKNKTSAAHLLVMSATPIPRTLALTLYGDLDISRITELPKGRQRVDTFVIDDSYRERLNGFISKQIENGGQCYIVCPAIEKNASEGDDDLFFTPSSLTELLVRKNSSRNIKNVEEYANNLRQKLPSLRIEVLHGKMKAKEKDAIMQRFSSGECDVLVSTTVIEVGINVPNASLMVIEDADRFGLAQLHQLRGRVGRGKRKSYCVLVSNLDSEKAKQRMEIMKTTYDGYQIAEKDLFMRGPGDFFASISSGNLRQSGGFEFKLANLCDDKELLQRAFSEAKALADKDPFLVLPENHLLLKEFNTKFSISESTIS